MATQLIQTGEAPRVVLSNIGGDLDIEVWDDSSVEIESDDRIDQVEHTDESVTIHGAHDDVRLRVPAGAEIVAEQVGGDVTARGVRSISVDDVGGDVDIEEVAETVQLERIGGDVEVHNDHKATGSGSLVAKDAIGGDAEIRGLATVELEDVHGDLQVIDGQRVTIGSIGGDCNIVAAEEFRYGDIGGDLEIEGNERTVVNGSAVGGDVAINAVASVALGSIGGDCAINNVSGEVRMGSIGSDCAINNIGGDIRMGSVAGDCAINAERSDVRLGNVGGDLSLVAAFPSEGATGVNVGGDAAIQLPREPNLTLRATVGGDVSGDRLVSSGGGMFTAVYGEGTGRLDLVVGGDLVLRGGTAPRSSSSSWGWDEFGAEMGRMGDELGREFSRLGDELERELSAAFGGRGRRGGRDLEREIRQRVEAQARRAEAQVHRAEERARREAERGRRGEDDANRRVHVRINDREWRFDADRIERLKQQAREAAKEGLVGAIEAIERALSGMGMPPTPEPPQSPQAPMPPRPPRPPQTPRTPTPPYPAATGQTIRIDMAGTVDTAEEAAADEEPPRNIEEERAAILQMVAEGRISPDEGDMLLDALN